MKTLFVLLVGIALGALGLYVYQNQPRVAGAVTPERPLTDSARDAARQAADRTRAVASDVGESLATKMQQWHLTRDDIKADLAKTGQVVRQNAARAGEKISDARIIAVLKAKFILDRDLSVQTIEVQSRDGDVTLNGTVPSEALVGRAVADALDTEGVHHVVAKLRVEAR